MESDFQFNLKSTRIGRVVLWDKSLLFRFRRICGKVFLALFVMSLGQFLYYSFASRRLFGLSILFFTLYIFSIVKNHFFEFIKKPKQTVLLQQVMTEEGRYNLAQFLSFETAKAVSDAARLCRVKGVSEITSSAFLYSLLKDNPDLNFVFSRALLNIDDFKKKLVEDIDKGKKGKSVPVYANDFKNSILEAVEVAKDKKHSRIETYDALCALAKYNPLFKQVLIDSNLKPEDIEELSEWLERIKIETAERKQFFKWKNLVRSGSLGKEWSTGYTVNLDKFSRDLSEGARIGAFSQIIGHETEIKAVERILSKEQENNVLLIGEEGSGRRVIIEDLVKKSFFGESADELNYKRVIELDLATLLTQVPSAQQAGDTLDLMFNEAVSAGNVILVINNFHNFVGGVDRPGALDITSIISSYLNMPQFRIIAVTSYKGLHKYIEQNPSILSFFGKVEVKEISQDESLTVLENLVFQKEWKFKQFISYPALRDIIKFCDKYLGDAPFPEKAIDLLDDVVSYVAQSKENIMLPKHVATIVSEKIEVPVGEVETKEKEKLLNLEDLIHQRIINQETAVREVAEALRRARTEISIRKGPMGAFLFLGPTGVGKTETAKSLTEIYFGKEEKMIRLDMSEFQEISDIPRLIGSADKEGLLTTKVIEDPFSLVLLDEIEKAHPNILNLFLQVIDEGYITDGLGRKVNFKNTIIIATSNAGYLIILDALRKGQSMDDIKEELIDHLFREKIFRPELINRFDAVVLFKALSKENLLDIAALLLAKLKKNLTRKDIDLVVTDELKQKIVDLSYDPKFGARQMNRVIQDKIGNVLAKALLSNEIKAGDRVELDAESFKLKKIS